MFNYVRIAFPVVCVLAFIDGALEPSSAAEPGAHILVESPLDFVVDDITPLLAMDPEKIAAQRRFAQTVGYVQYKIGEDPKTLEAVKAKVINDFGPGTLLEDGQLVWSVKNLVSGSKWGKTITMTIRKNENGCYFIKADARRAHPQRERVAKPVTAVTSPEFIAVKTLSYGTVPSFIQGVATKIKDSDVVQIIRQKDKVLQILDPIQMNKNDRVRESNARQTPPESLPEHP